LLQRLTAVCLLTFCANALWAFVLPGRSGRAAAAVGALIAATLALAIFASAAVRRRLQQSPPAFLESLATVAGVLVPFALPVFFLRFAPTLAFWRLDGRSALLIGWLLAITWAIWCERRLNRQTDRPAAGLLLALFILFSSALWLTVVSDSGISSFVLGTDRRGHRVCQSDPFTTMITVWETNPASEHLFLSWQGQESFDRRVAYANHVYPYLFTMYGWIAAARRLGGLTLYAATNSSIFLPIVVLVAAFGTLLARSGFLRDRTHLFGLLTLFLALGVMLTTWRLWIDLVRFNSDNPHPLLAAVFIFVYAFLLPPVHTRAAAVASAVFAALGPVYTPMLILSVVCMFGQGGRDVREVVQRNRALMTICVAAIVAGAVTYLTPRLLIEWKGYHSQASTFLFRSGLDGDTRYFSGILQAVLAPCPVGCCYSRPLSDLIFPAFVPLAIFGPLALREARAATFSIVRQVVFLTTLYFASLILFPQSVSVHPYMYDHLLLIPIVVTGAMAMLTAPVERRLTGAGLLAFLLFAGGIIMANLIAIAQGLARAVAYFTQ